MVITNDCIDKDDDESRSNWSDFKRHLGGPKKWITGVKEFEEKIAVYAGTDSSNVMIDVPVAPPFAGPGHAQIYFSEGVIRPLNQVFPAEGWANAHEAYRSASYIFALSDNCATKVVGDSAKKWLSKDIGVQVNDYASRMAKTAD